MLAASGAACQEEKNTRGRQEGEGEKVKEVAASISNLKPSHYERKVLVRGRLASGGPGSVKHRTSSTQRYVSLGCTSAQTPAYVTVYKRHLVHRFQASGVGVRREAAGWSREPDDGGREGGFAPVEKPVFL